MSGKRAWNDGPVNATSLSSDLTTLYFQCNWCGGVLAQRRRGFAPNMGGLSREAQDRHDRDLALIRAAKKCNCAQRRNLTRPAPKHAGAAQAPSIVDQLAKLTELWRSGAISDAEFSRIK